MYIPNFYLNAWTLHAPILLRHTLIMHLYKLLTPLSKLLLGEGGGTAWEFDLANIHIFTRGETLCQIPSICMGPAVYVVIRACI